MGWSDTLSYYVLAYNNFMDARRLQEKQRTCLLMVVVIARVSMFPASWHPVPIGWHEVGCEKPTHVVGCVTGEKHWAMTPESLTIRSIPVCLLFQKATLSLSSKSVHSANILVKMVWDNEGSQWLCSHDMYEQGEPWRIILNNNSKNVFSNQI